ncbi:uncharacterized protein BO97DRAFT_443959 [Aspergillus homomorphus CBS 101889]|uniref:Uncharacterized protein n=1 Tax=Aspergillus homomorphus (strain CBS 101889) TaxID=1450537 RepID=A0A395HYJ1_ASPHC|nr:hypothetical protein BO97DRAFT_443959 [Aspergillus homomorphus CBS 101889]RAL11314.1 hypothetical protein BO97DRAFT_443959 [Aspergillus homomorphus CBS 101889]
MSLKRKASFPTLELQNGTSASMRETWKDNQIPQHLNSRTRKRFRNDRPEDEVVYENTLRWLFTAQQQQSSVPLACEEEQPEFESTLSPETVDPRQQTLLRFFRPCQSFPNKSSPNTFMQKASDAPFFRAAPVHLHNMQTSSLAQSTGSSAFSSASQTTYTDMDIEMESGSDESNYQFKGRAGGLAWMGHPRFNV